MDTSRKWKFYFVQSLTFARIWLILIFFAVNLFANKPLSGMWFSVAFIAMATSAFTDLFDGYFARKFKVETRLGAYADPLTDKVFYLTAFPTLIYLAGVGQGNDVHAGILLGLTILFLMRDQWISFLRSIGALYGVDAKANWSGKARTLISFPAIGFIYYHLAAPKDWWLQVHVGVAYGLEFACIVINIISIWVYSRHYWPTLKKEISLNNFQDSSR